jgi:hypothetical protein
MMHLWLDGRCRRGAPLVPLTLVLGALAGCGGGSDDRLTKDEFLKQGNAICAKGDKQIETAAGKAFATPDNPTKAEVVTFAKTVVLPTVQDEVDELRALSPPKEDEARIDEILDKAQAALDKLRANPALLVSDTGFEEANRLAGAYGLTACAD